MPWRPEGDDLSVGRAGPFDRLTRAWPPHEAEKGWPHPGCPAPPRAELGTDWHFSCLNCPSPGRQAGAAGGLGGGGQDPAEPPRPKKLVDLPSGSAIPEAPQ